MILDLTPLLHLGKQCRAFEKAKPEVPFFPPQHSGLVESSQFLWILWWLMLLSSCSKWEQILVLLSFLFFIFSSKKQERMRPHFVLFGDSITEQSFRPGGWGAALADAYSRKVPFEWNIFLYLYLELNFWGPWRKPISYILFICSNLGLFTIYFEKLMVLRNTHIEFLKEISLYLSCSFSPCVLVVFEENPIHIYFSFVWICSYL